jgi:hypothetical protein
MQIFSFVCFKFKGNESYTCQTVRLVKSLTWLLGKIVQFFVTMTPLVMTGVDALKLN